MIYVDSLLKKVKERKKLTEQEYDYIYCLLLSARIYERLTGSNVQCNKNRMRNRLTAGAAGYEAPGQQDNKNKRYIRPRTTSLI